MTAQTVRVYTRPVCQQCNATKRWLDNRGVQYVVDDATDEQTVEAAKSLGITSAPIVVVDLPDGSTEQWGGFRPDLLAQHVVIP